MRDHDHRVCRGGGRNRDILISGAGIAGPALAFWLSRRGFNPTVVERAPALRSGGQAVDFRGPAQMDLLRRMGVLDEIRAHQTDMGDLSFVDAAGRTRVTLSAAFASGEVEILRGDLSRILYEASRVGAEYVFGDSISALTEEGDHIDVTFQSGARRSFDLVIGADGLHSNVRSLAFGPEALFVRPTGYRVAIFSVPNALRLSREGRIFCSPGKAIGLYGDHPDDPARAVLYFADLSKWNTWQDTQVVTQKESVAEIFDGVGWQAPGVIAALWDAPDFYVDSIAQVRMDAWSRGRVALIGDAGYGGTLGGMGTGVAVVAAYVLAGELEACHGDHHAAFARYAERLGGYAKRCQQGAASVGSFMAPRTTGGIWLRDTLLRISNLAPGGLLERIAADRASGIALEPYDDRPAGLWQGLSDGPV